MFLDFEKPIEDIEEKILLLKNSTSASLVDLNSDIEKLQQKKSTLIKKIFSNLTPWQITQLARHPMRPYTCLLYTSPSPRDRQKSRMPSSA